MKRSNKAILIISAIEAVILGVTLFLFDYYPDKADLNQSLLKGLAMGVLIAILNTITIEWWLRRTKKPADK